MLKCIQATGLQEFDSSCTSGIEVNASEKGLCKLSSLLTSAKLQFAKSVSGEMGKELWVAGAEIVRMYLLSNLTDISATGAVPIDDKIEQAMDLVKGHLMFAVREEVELLKEQIRNLIERNAQLEYENKFLRDHASSDTLTKLAGSNGQPQ